MSRVFHDWTSGIPPLIFPQPCRLLHVTTGGCGFDQSTIVRCTQLLNLDVEAVTAPFPFALIASLPSLLEFTADGATLSGEAAGVYAGRSGIVTNLVLSRLNETNPALRLLDVSSSTLPFGPPSQVDTWPHIVCRLMFTLRLNSLPQLRTGPAGPIDERWLADMPALTDLELDALINVRLHTSAFNLASTYLNIISAQDTTLLGDLSPLYRFPSLAVLFIDGSGIRSTLPVNVSDCWPQLAQISVSGGQLFGPLPSFRYLPALVSVVLNQNHLVGPIGEDFAADSPQLSTVFLANNALESPAPLLRGLGQGAQPQVDLSFNLLSSLPNLTCYAEVIELRLQGNPIVDSLPLNFWELLPNADSIDLSYTGLFGPVPNAPVGLWVNPISFFSIAHTAVSGPLPRNILARSLDFSYCNFSGPVWLYDEPDPVDVVSLHLESAGSITCPILIGQLSTLQSLRLANNSGFAGCDFTDSTRVQLPSSITEIDFSDCDWMPATLFLASNWVVVRGNRANLIGVDFNANAVPLLTLLSLDFNRLPNLCAISGFNRRSFMSWLLLSDTLQSLSLRGCGLNAQVPTIMHFVAGTAPALQVLRLDNVRNNAHRARAAPVRQLGVRVSDLWSAPCPVCFQNSLSGSFSNTFLEAGALSFPPSLQDLSVAMNPLIEGLLPSVPSVYTNLRSFDCSQTAISGTIPTSFATMTVLSQFNMAGTTIACSLVVDDADRMQCADLSVVRPSQTTAMQAQSLADPNAGVHCAALIIASTGSSDVTADPSYHFHTQCTCDANSFGLNALCSRCPEGCTCVQDRIANCFPVVRRGSIAVNPASDSSGSRPVVAGSIVAFSVAALLPCPRTVTGDSLCNPDGIAWPSFYRIVEQAGDASLSASVADSDPSSSATEVDLSGWCAAGHTGRLCAACSPSYFSSGRWCLRCLSEGVHILILVANLLLICALIAYLYAKSPGAATSAKGLQLYVSRLAQVGTVGVTLRPMHALNADASAAALPSLPASPSFSSSDAAAAHISDPANPLKLLIFHCQQLSLLLHTSTSLPPVMTGLLSALSSGSSGLSLSSLVALECLSDWTLSARCWMAVLVPALVAIVAGITALISRKRGHSSASRAMQLQGRDEPLLSAVPDAADPASSSIVPRIYSVCVSLLYFLVFPCAQTVLSAVACTDTRESGRSYLNLYPDQSCDAEWRRSVLPPAVLGLLFWVVAFLLGSTLMLLRLRARVAAASCVPQSASADAPSASESASASALSVWPVCSDLLLPYCPRFWYWDQLLLMRRLMLVAAVTIIPASSLYLPLVLFAIIQLSALQQHWAQPYAHSLLNAGELASLYLLLINYISAIILQTGLTEGGFQHTANGWAAALFVVNAAFLLILVAGLFGWARKWIAQKLTSRSVLHPS